MDLSCLGAELKKLRPSQREDIDDFLKGIKYLVIERVFTRSLPRDVQQGLVQGYERFEELNEYYHEGLTCQKYAKEARSTCMIMK